MNTIPAITLIQDLFSLPKNTLSEICTDLDLNDDGYKGDLTNRIFQHVANQTKLKESSLASYSDKIFGGKTSITWYQFDTHLSIKDFNNLIDEALTFNPYEGIHIPASEDITTIPQIIGAAKGLKENEVFLRFMYKSGVNQEVYATGIETTPRTSLTTAYYNSDSGILELRGDPRKAETIAKEIARLLKQQINLSQVETPFNHKIGDIADSLNGELIDATSKPEIILEEFDEDQSSAVANVLTALDVYFNTNDSEELEKQLQEANKAFGNQKISVPFSALILSGMGKVGLGGENEIRGLPLFDYLSPNLQHQGGFIRFRFNEGGIEKDYTVRIGMKSRSIFFATPATEQVIAYVRENVII
ncbi:hypothetical protein [Oceanobacillus sojae]|uniref:hypothetical protein n=1 Tax=Oceanobacillus sojae TaxID=582851 RepID=UPI0021A47242|nr:hypothetical protein [Oceanobacillus sojae]MCT1901870.1 hypothetical protein [Oceanobacillus sojae]